MTDQLDGRDLDRACAEAMGKIGGRWSTDPSTQAEKLATWDADEEMGGVTLWQDWSGKKCTWTARIGECAGGAVQRHLREGGGREQRFWEATGTTIDQALARLICSVDAARRSK